MNVLVIAPHPDDESIGCGGSLCQHTDAGDRVVAVYLTSGELGLKNLAREQAWQTREHEARRAAKILGLAEVKFLRAPDWSAAGDKKRLGKEVRAILQRESPALIYLPHPRDAHPDHRAALSIVRTALKGMDAKAPVLRGYEVWTPLAEHDQVKDITAAMPRKLRALRAHRSQLNQFDYVRAVRGLNEYRGALAARCGFAEVFQTLSLKSQP